MADTSPGLAGLGVAMGLVLGAALGTVVAVVIAVPTASVTGYSTGAGLVIGAGAGRLADANRGQDRMALRILGGSAFVGAASVLRSVPSARGRLTLQFFRERASGHLRASPMGCSSAGSSSGRFAPGAIHPAGPRPDSPGRDCPGTSAPGPTLRHRPSVPTPAWLFASRSPTSRKP